MITTEPSQSHSNFNFSMNFASIINASNVHSMPCFNSESTWIVDTRAIYHMIWDKSLFASYNTLHNLIKVGLPDGTTKLVHIVGTVNLTDNIVLKHVLFFPDFKHNILSVSKLLARNNLLPICTSSSYQL